MANYRKRNGKWNARVRIKNEKQISKTFILKEDAIKWAKDCEVKIQKGLIEDLHQANRITLKELLQRYKNEETLKNEVLHKRGIKLINYVDKILLQLDCQI
jgi:hypothetical protein